MQVQIDRRGDLVELVGHVEGRNFSMKRRRSEIALTCAASVLFAVHGYRGGSNTYVRQHHRIA